MHRLLVVLLCFSFSESAFGSTFLEKCPRLCECKVLEWFTTVTCVNVALNGVFSGVPNETHVLIVRYTQVEDVQGDASSVYTQLNMINLANNKLKTLPAILKQAPNVRTIDLRENGISSIPANAFQQNTYLTELILSENTLVFIDQAAFSGLSLLTTLQISAAPGLKSFSSFMGLANLTTLELNRCSLEYIGFDLCRQLPKLTDLDVHSNHIIRMINFSLCVQMGKLDMSRNRIESIPPRSFVGANHAFELLLGGNQLKTIPEDAFIGLSGLDVLDLSSNELTWIHPDAFAPLKAINTLRISKNAHLGELPVNGLESIRIIDASNNPNMRKFPSASKLKHLNQLQLTYAYHCCEFLEKNTRKSQSDDQPFISIQNDTVNEHFHFPFVENRSVVHPVPYDDASLDSHHSNSDNSNGEVVQPMPDPKVICQPEPGRVLPGHATVSKLILR